jgi:antirestriction protein ArdC
MAVALDTPPALIRRRPQVERLVSSLITLLQAGTTPWRREWDCRSGGHHVNLITGRRYRGVNPVLLSLGMQLRGSHLPYWCGFAEARSLGIFPRRGSRAVHVLRPHLQTPSGVPLVPMDDAAEASAVDGPVGDDPSLIPGLRLRVTYRPVAVFNAADLEGDALPALVETRRAAAVALARSEPERLAAAEAVLGAWPVPVEFAGDIACYHPACDRIQLPERTAFHDASGLYATWAHEAIHSTGHPSRLARDLSGGMGERGDGGRAYAREELVAELGAVLLGERLEIGSAMANHAAYLGGWIEMLREGPEVLFQVLADARRAADLISPESLEERMAGATAQPTAEQTA